MEKGQQVIIVKGSGYSADDSWLTLTPIVPNGKTALVIYLGFTWYFKGQENGKETVDKPCSDGRSAVNEAVQFIMGDGGLYDKYFWNAVMSGGFITVR